MARAFTYNSRCKRWRDEWAGLSVIGDSIGCGNAIVGGVMFCLLLSQEGRRRSAVGAGESTEAMVVERKEQLAAVVALLLGSTRSVEAVLMGWMGAIGGRNGRRYM
jgi:hypothetical protein